MRETIRDLVIDDEVIVREGGVQRRYYVTGRRGSAAPEIDLRGVAGAQRTLIDGGDTVWLRRETRKGSEHRRVQEVVWVSTPELPSSVEDHPPKPKPITALDLGRLIACSSGVKVAGWVIDQMVAQAQNDPRADEIVRAMQVYVLSRERLPGIG